MAKQKQDGAGKTEQKSLHGRDRSKDPRTPPKPDIHKLGGNKGIQQGGGKTAKR